MSDLHLAVIRFGRLGDLVMIEPALRWAAGIPGLRVSLVTDPKYIPAFAPLLEGVELCSVVPPCDLVVDLHRVARSRRARRGHSWIGVRKEDLRRRLLVHFPRLGVQPRRSWPERHLEVMARALGRLGIDGSLPPSPVPRLPAPRDPVGRRLGLVLGAGHETKRWPVRHWEELAGRWRGEVVAFVGPGEEELAAAAGLVPWPDASLPALIDGLASCDVVVSGDTGPLHLAGAMGRGVVGLFGPTPTQSGFWVWGERGEALRVAGLSCSPCHLHGADLCPRGHHRCLVSLEPDRVLAGATALRTAS